MLEQDAVRLLEASDPSLFTVPSATSPGDRISLLAVQNVARSLKPGYAYLEIGSHLGGTLVPHLLDPACARVLSIDKRPDSQPDERARRFDYKGVTTATMMEQLRPFVPLAAFGKLTTFDADASQVSPAALGCPVDLALIDGEHTNVAAFSDFLSLLPALAPDGMVAFHDANLVLDAVRNIECLLRYRGTPHATFLLPDVVGLIALGASRPAAAARLSGMAHDAAAFTVRSKRALHEMIAQAVAEGAHLD